MTVRKSKSPAAVALRYRVMLATAVAAAISPLAARATDISWSNTSGGFYTTNTNWNGLVVPGVADVADFNLLSSYTVIVGSSPTNAELAVRAGNVTLAVGSNTYSQTSSNVALAVAGGTSVAENATLTLSSGTLNSGVTGGGDVYVGGITSQAAGVNSVGVVNLGGTSVWNVGDDLILGNYGQGTLNQTGGTLNITSFLSLGNGSASIGRYNLSGGLKTSLIDIIGGFGTGVVAQSGGTNNAGYLELGGNAPNAPGAPAVGLYNLSAGLLTVSAYDSVGVNGRGVFTQIGGTHVANTTLLVGDQPGSSGTYTLSAGLVLSNDGISVGNSGVGAFNQSGGTHTVSGNAAFSVGDQTTGVGTYALGSGATLTANGQAFVGNYGNGTFNQTGGTATFLSGFNIGNNAGGVGTVNLTGGNLNVSGGALLVGYSGNGTFSQSNGAVVATTLDVAYNPGSVGDYILLGGTVAAINSTISDDKNTFAYFQQAGGVFTVSGTLSLGRFSPQSYGNYLQSGGLLNANVMNVGATGNGNYSLGGGTANVALLTAGGMASSPGTVNVSAGNLNVTSALVLGQVPGGVGVMTQSGGSVTVASLTLGQAGPASTFAAAAGTYTLYAGSLTGNFENVGVAGGGTFNQLGGTNAVTGLLTVGAAGGAFGNYTLQGGSLSAPNVTVNIDGSFTQSGGALFTSNPLLNLGTFTYSGGTFTGRLNNQNFLQLGGGANFAPTNGLQNDGAFSIAGGQTFTAIGAGLANNGTINLFGGTITGPTTLANNGQIYGYGTLAGTGGFTNANLVTQSTGNFVLSNTGLNQNLGTINLAAGHALQLTGSGLTNAGVVSLNSALLSGTGPFVNAAGGVVAGPGLISAPFSNTAGTILVQTGTLNVVSPFVNSGYIQLAGLPGTLTGGTVTNVGSIQGVGSVGSNVNNSGTIEPIGGTLAESGTLTNLAPGLIRAATGNKFLAVTGLANNLGTISLTGGTFDNNNKPLTNASVITGFGTLSTGGLTNAAGAQILVANGPLTVNGPVTNALGGTVSVNYSPALFTGPVVNNGRFKITGTTVSYAAPFTNNGIYASDPATTHFSTLSVGPAGALIGGVGDKFYVSGDLDSASTQAAAWDTADGAELHFEGPAASHVLTLTGADLGTVAAGYRDNFAWGKVVVDAGDSLTLADGNASPGGALYAKSLELVAAPTDPVALRTFIAAYVVNADAANPLDLYYDPGSADNAYLADGVYALGNGGTLAPAATPEPVSLTWAALLGAGLLSRRAVARRRQL